MNLDWYYTFVILAKTLNYRLASEEINLTIPCLLYTSPSPRDMRRSRMPSSA
ncbi:hypothetical protein JMUB7527_28740 [Staphylococcus aureus]